MKVKGIMLTHNSSPLCLELSSPSLIIHLQYFYSTLKDTLLFQYGTTPLPPPLKLVQTLNLKHGKPFDVMDLLWAVDYAWLGTIGQYIECNYLVVIWTLHFFLLPIGHQSICSADFMWSSLPSIVFFSFYLFVFLFFLFAFISIYFLF